MKFHKEGYPTLLVTILFSTIIISIAKLAFPEFAIAHWFAYILSGFLLIVVVQFFRHPTRMHTISDSATIRRLPANHQRTRVEVGRGNHRHDRRVGDAHAGEPAHAELIVDDG